MPKLSKDQVKKVAKLANLPLTPKEEEKYSKQLSEVLVYVEKLNELDTNGVEPMNQVTGLINIARKDTTLPSLSQEDALKNATSKEQGFFKAKAIFE